MTYEEAKQEVAVKYGLGSTLVTGHKASYFEEAAKMYANAKVNNALEVVRELN